MTPVAVGTALAVAEGHRLQTLPLSLAVLCALLIQVATNLHNDAMDGLRGTDGPQRVGPARVTASGWASATTVLWAARLCALTALLLGAGLVWMGGGLVLGIGLASLAAGWAYSGGPRPVSHGPLGEGFVLVFFGGVAAAGSHWLQAGHTTPAAWLAGGVVGMPAAAVLMINNLRDLDSDTQAGRRTLVWHLGLRRTRQLHAWLLLSPSALLACLALLYQPGAALACLGLPLAWQRVRALRTREPGAWLNEELGATARLGLIQGLLLCTGLLFFPHR